MYASKAIRYVVGTPLGTGAALRAVPLLPTPKGAGGINPLLEQVVDNISGELHQFVDRRLHSWSCHT